MGVKKMVNGARLYGDFTDVSGTKVTVEDSSLAHPAAVRILTKNPLLGQDIPPHLDKDQVEKMIKALKLALKHM